MEDEKIITLFEQRSERALAELDTKYGKVCRSVSHNILHCNEDVEECVNDAYLGVWNAIPPEKPNPLATFVCRIIETASGALDMKSPSGFCVNSVMQINAHYRTKYYKTRGLRQAVVCHEYGHTLCLDHNTSSSPSIMRRVTKQYYNLDGAPKWTTPKSADIVPINLKY